MFSRGVLQALALSLILNDIECFHPKLPAFVNAHSASNPRHTGVCRSSSASSTIADVKTSPIQGMKPGTSGLRKKVEVWQGIDDDANKHYVENFIQSLIDTAKEANDGEMLNT